MLARILTLISNLRSRVEGTEIIEFAVSLPLLVVLVVGIYDFGSAFTLKHKLSSAVLDGTRVGANQLHPPNPGADDGCGAPSSVCVIRDTVDSNLLASNVDDCGLGAVNASHPSTFTWIFTGTGSCSGSSLKIERGSINPNTGTLPSPFDTAPYTVEDTKVTLTYPYQWKFNQAFKLLDRNANYLNSPITVSASMQNL